MMNEKIKCSFQTVPFKSSLSFEYLLAELETIKNDKNNPLQTLARETLKKVEGVPSFKDADVNFDVVKENQELVNQMMAFVFNPLNTDIEVSSVLPPFMPRPIYYSNKYASIFKGENKKLEVAKDMDNNMMLLAAIFRAYLIILIRFYDASLNVDIPFVYKLTDTTDNSVKYFKVLVNHKYTDVRVKGRLKKLSKKDLKSLFDNTNDMDYWNKMIPLEKFTFTGILCFNWIDITHEHVISQLKSDLLDKHSIISQAGFERIKQKVRTLMGIPDLEFGLAAFSDFESTLNQNVIWKSILPQTEVKCDQLNNTLYEDAYRSKRIVLTDDMRELESNPVVDQFLKKGILSHAVVPLILDEEIVGMIEFGAKEIGRLNFVQIKRFHELFPVFAIALRRSKDEINDRIQAIIQEECTAIHPTVEWKFWDAAGKMLDKHTDGEAVKMESIVFNDVVPIYGASDIRNSSIERNRAIQSDLSEHLTMAKQILVVAQVNKDMPLLDQLVYKIDQHLETVNKGLKAGDEVSILEFIKREIEPVFERLKERDTDVVKSIDNYYSRMDDELGVVYKKRKDFEDSLTAINDTVGNILDEEQDRAQKVYPHYYEKYRTDGVEYNIYIGQSMVKDYVYDPLYVKNLRLWQLMVKVEIAKKIRELKPTLKTELDVTQLVLVHSNPLSIAFRQDEKKFDVAGAYNIRYEITKKRIDKALIKGSQERVTQVGKIAIIYSHSEEIVEYKKYIDYLISKGYLKDSVEDVELEDLKGASGLRALRVEVNFDSSSPIDEINISEIKKVIESN